MQLVEFSHVSEDMYAAGEYLPEDFEEERRRQWRWNYKRMSRVKEIVPNMSRKKVLDFGCGTGGFLQQAQEEFREVIGFELNEHARELHRKAGWTCVASLDEVQDDVDIIVLFHVLEHLPEPWKLLGDLQTRFSRAEMFVIEVPNTGEVLNSVFKNPAYRSNQVNTAHLYYFTSKTLRRVVESSGMEVLLDSQIQRYSLANNFGWLATGKGGGQDLWEFFNDERLNEEYERVLVSHEIADSIFLVCARGTR